MSAPNVSWPAVRIFHLTGGVRAFNPANPEVELEPAATDGGVYRLRLPDYHSAFRQISSLGLQIIGVDFYTHAMELQGQAPPEWRVFSQGWPSSTLAQSWVEIAHAGYEAKHGHLWDLASRISQQVRTCNWQLRQVSQAYAAQLQGCSKRGAINSGSRFADGFTGLAYIAVQSYLIDACILRDYLAEFMARIIWAQIPKAESSVSSIAGLVKKVLPHIPRPDALADLVERIAADNGWLQTLGAYRDLVVHTAPLVLAGGRWYAMIEHRPFPAGQMMPVLRLPLPIKPMELKAERSSQKLFVDFSDQENAFARAAKGQLPWVDCLDYLWQTHGQLAALAAQVAQASPLKGKMMTFDDSHSIGEIRGKRG